MDQQQPPESSSTEPAADSAPPPAAEQAAASTTAAQPQSASPAAAQPPASPPPGSPPPTAPPASPPPASPAPAAAYGQSSWQAAVDNLGPAPGVQFATYASRVVAYLIDGFIVFVAIVALSIVLGGLVAAGASNDGELNGVGIVAALTWLGATVFVSILYFPYFWQSTGQTPGMRLLNIKVVRDRDGGPVTWGPAILRWIGYAIDSIVFGLPIGWLWPLVDSRRRAWHDLIGGTVVISVPR